jgi:hypothetical protein
METINDNLSVSEVRNINPTTSSSENIYQYELPEVFGNYASKVTAITIDSQMD